MIERFRAMNTDVLVVAPESGCTRRDSLKQAVQQVFEDAECTFSRFRADSELSRLNASNAPTPVSAQLFDALERARGYWELTDGWFDVTIAPALCALGYDRSFVAGGMDRRVAWQPHTWSHTSGDLILNHADRTVEMPPGAAIDCGGFIKGWTVDRAAKLLPCPAVVDAGGDAVLHGAWPTSAGWQVHVEDPWQPGRVLLSFAVGDRAVATSGTNRRHWRVAGSEAHHLIDPHTKKPGESDLVQVTVVAASAELADVVAKTVCLRGQRDGERFLKQLDDVAAVLVPRDGRTRIYGEVSK